MPAAGGLERSDAVSAEPYWLAVLPSHLDGAFAAARVRDLNGGPGGVLTIWTTGARPHPDACRVDPAIIDTAGPAAVVSLVQPAAGAWPLFDDPAVVRAVIRAATLPHLSALSTLTADPVHFAGSLLATDPAIAAGWPGWWCLDPFARLGPRRRLHIEPGLLSARVTVLGPGTQRRAGAPWPARW